MDLYHKFCSAVDHKKLWPKEERCLNKDHIKIFRRFDFIKILNDTFGTFQITDEDEIGREEIYWRLVRPDCEDDVGPLHADSWFWELNNSKEKDSKRFKIWIPIFCEENETGFMYASGSHKRKWHYDSVLKDGKFKPIPKINENEIIVSKFMGKPGDIILFNDKLIHGGYSTSNKTRVSLEFTLNIN